MQFKKGGELSHGKDFQMKASINIPKNILDWFH